MLPTETFAPVPQGPVAYAREIRRVGWLAALLLPALMLGAAVAAKNLLTCPTGQVCSSSFATNWVLPGMALPTAILWGFPLFGDTRRYIGMAATSALLWALLGVWAAGRATRHPIASWGTWVREYVILLLGVWIGVFVGLLALAALVGQGTFSNLL